MAERAYAEVAKYLHRLLGEYSWQPAFHQALVRLLSRPGRVLAAHGPAKWPPLVLLTCRALAGDGSAAVAAAAMVELAIAASNVVDDVIDDEWNEQDLPAGRALNGALALLGLAQRPVGELAQSLGPERAVQIGDLLAHGIAAACAGQDLDLQLEATPNVSEEAAHEMTRRKSGTLVATACQVGAAVATEDREVVRLAGTLGGHIGVVAQLLNDIRGVVVGTDLRRRKKSLPVAYAVRCAREEHISRLLDWYEGRGSADAGDEREIATLIRELGAVDYAWVVAEAHRQEALAAIRALVETTGRQEAVTLRRLVPSPRALWADREPK